MPRSSIIPIRSKLKRLLDRHSQKEDWGPTVVSGASHEQAKQHHADYLALRDALESE